MKLTLAQRARDLLIAIAVLGTLMFGPAALAELAGSLT